eukprot:GHVU01142601.1.p1 GENE.GHVU01142601.1~~GHVU01142601.1.p1  ORF type:complete len:226 (+),score=21.72 GHVU01142601.1:48-725(+)
MGARTPRQCNEASLCCRCPGYTATATEGDKVVGYTATLLLYASFINTDANTAFYDISKSKDPDAKTPFYNVGKKAKDPVWIFPKITDASANGVYMKSLVAVHGCESNRMIGALKRYKALCGLEATGGAAGGTPTTSALTRANHSAVAKACLDFDRIWEHCTQKLGTQDNTLEKVAEKLRNDSSKVAAKYLDKKRATITALPKPHAFRDLGFEEMVRSVLLRIPRR